MEHNYWLQEDIPEPRPKPRYGQSQLYLDDNHLLILGGCGGPSNVFNDVWLLSMGQSGNGLDQAGHYQSSVHWKWIQCRVENVAHGASHMWCHPAVLLGNYAIILGKNRLPKQQQGTNSKNEGVENYQSASLNQRHQQARWNVIPQLRRGVNRGYGAIRRPHPSQSYQRTQENENNLDLLQGEENVFGCSAATMGGSDRHENILCEDQTDAEVMSISEDEDENAHPDLAIVPIQGDHETVRQMCETNPAATSSLPVYRSCVTLNINSSQQDNSMKPATTPSSAESQPAPKWGQANLDENAIMLHQLSPEQSEVPCSSNSDTLHKFTEETSELISDSISHGIGKHER